MRKIIFLTLLIILSSFVSASFPETGLVHHLAMEDTTDSKGSWTLVVDGATITTGKHNNAYYFDGNDKINASTLFDGEYTTCAWVNSTHATNNQLVYTIGADAARELWAGHEDNRYTCGIRRGDGAQKRVYSTSTYSVNDYKFVCCVYGGSNLSIFVNGSYEDKIDVSSSKTPVGNFGIGYDIVWGGSYFEGEIDELSVWNRDLTDSEILDAYQNFYVDSTPPIISNLNCTSCNVPNGDTTSPYETEDTTPTFKFNTSENAWCAIGVNDTNYTTMGASRNCTDSGEGAKGHTCTLTAQDKFTSVGEDYLYISCKDSSGNEGDATNTSKSNSGKIRMEILGANVTQGNDAIELGINNVIPSATIYTNQQVYVRNIDDNQALATFDKVALYGNQRWAFNYRASESEPSIGTFYNLTPVFYFLEMVNLSISMVTEGVTEMINSTKT